MGKKHSQRVPSYGHWNVQLFQNEPSLVKFNYTFPTGAAIGIYGGKNRVPSHTKYDFMEVIGTSHNLDIISGKMPSGGRMVRSSIMPGPGSPSTSSHANLRKSQVAEFIQFLDRGTWYISIYNDGSEPQDITFIPLIAGECVSSLQLNI